MADTISTSNDTSPAGVPELLPCPFCGGAVRLVEGDESAYIQCVEVKMHRALWFQGDNAAADEVREEWNRRASRSADTDALVAALRFYDGAWSFTLNQRYGGLEWKPTKALLDDCGNTARTALQQHEEKKL